MSRPLIAVIIPTIKGREMSLRRCVNSYNRFTTDTAQIRITIVEDSPSAGEGWQMGVERHVQEYGAPDFVHLTNDDNQLIGARWAQRCIETVKQDRLPCPVVLDPSGKLESAGGSMGSPDDLVKTMQPDWTPVDFTNVPFMSWDQWQKIGMIPTHYCSDVWVSYKGRTYGMETVLRQGYTFIHHNEQVGRGAGMPQPQRAMIDRKVMQDRLTGAV